MLHSVGPFDQIIIQSLILRVERLPFRTAIVYIHASLSFIPPLVSLSLLFPTTSLYPDYCYVILCSFYGRSSLSR
jgi:hypothetical protein